MTRQISTLREFVEAHAAHLPDVTTGLTGGVPYLNYDCVVDGGMFRFKCPCGITWQGEHDIHPETWCGQHFDKLGVEL